MGRWRCRYDWSDAHRDLLAVAAVVSPLRLWRRPGGSCRVTDAPVVPADRREGAPVGWPAGGGLPGQRHPTGVS
jgi:hypothetical protein